MSIDKKLGIEIVVLVVAIIACGISIRSCSVAQNALDTSREQFTAENRPYIVVSPEKFEDSKKYCEISQTEDGKVRFHVQYKIQNIGTVAAIGINSPGELHVFDKSGQVNVSSVQEPGVITMGPGEHIYRNYDIFFSGNEPDWAKKTIDELKNKEGEISVIWFELRYQNELDESIQYQTKVAYSLSVDSVRILTQETRKILVK